jgi:hypothetical protein
LAKLIPKIELSPWFRWKERGNIENSDKAGVYTLAKFKTASPQTVNPLDPNIIYFGETCKSLKVRWLQFDASAFHGLPGHSGGKTYRNTYRDEGLDLYVAAMPVLIANDVLRSSFIRFAERKLILDFVQRRTQRPTCNRK